MTKGYSGPSHRAVGVRQTEKIGNHCPTPLGNPLSKRNPCSAGWMDYRSDVPSIGPGAQGVRGALTLHNVTKGTTTKRRKTT